MVATVTIAKETRRVPNCRWLPYLATVFVVTSSTAKAEPPAAQYWKSDFVSAEKEARDTGKVLLIHFHAHWCGPCRVMERTVLNSAEVTKELSARRIIAVKVDTDRHKDLIQRFQLKTLPTDIYLSAEGKILARQTGATARSAYVSAIRRHAPQQQQALIASHASHNAAPRHQMARVVPRQATKELKATANTKQQTGLSGYCPVTIQQRGKWVRGKAEFQYVAGDIVYHCVSAAELELLKSDPETFLPVIQGYDPVVFRDEGKLVSGRVELGARFRERLYLFSSQQSRDRFLRKPAEYATVVSVTLTKRQPVSAAKDL